jgi:hypothetical protein
MNLSRILSGILSSMIFGSGRELAATDWQQVGNDVMARKVAGESSE